MSLKKIAYTIIGIPYSQQAFETDGNAMNEKRILWLGEVSNGKDTKLILNKMQNHLYVLEHGLAKQKYKHDKGHFIGWIFEHDGLKKSVMRRMQEDKTFAAKERFILFKTIEELEKEFFHGWSRFTGEQVSFIPEK